MFVTVQREVADRLMAGPGSREYGPLSVVVGAGAEVRLIATVPAECFWPRPEVTSAMVSILRRARPVVGDLEALAALCQRVFGQRRKQLGSILGRGVEFPAGIRPDHRAEELSVEQLVALSKVTAVG
jgi:16S rRNA (adenine1518-N6/adenine1519-N6)-dimethyltransferase